MTHAGIDELQENQSVMKECYMATLREVTHEEQLINELDIRDEQTKQRGYLVEELISVPIKDDLNRVVKISSNLCEEDHQHLISFL